MALEVVDTRVHANGAALLHVREGGLSDEEMRMDVDVEGVEPLVGREFGKLFLNILSAVIEHKRIDRPELVHVRLDELIAVFLFGEIQRDGVNSDFGSAFLDDREHVLHVFFFLSCR